MYMINTESELAITELASVSSFFLILRPQTLLFWFTLTLSDSPYVDCGCKPAISTPLHHSVGQEFSKSDTESETMLLFVCLCVCVSGGRSATCGSVAGYRGLWGGWCRTIWRSAEHHRRRSTGAQAALCGERLQPLLHSPVHHAI